AAPPSFPTRRSSDLVLTPALGVAGVVLFAACGGSTSPYGGGGGGGGCTPTTTKVCMETVTFNPASLTVAAGTSVTWQNGTSVSRSEEHTSELQSPDH